VEISFPVHSIHVEENIKPAYGCEQCHAAPEDVLTEGHIFVGDVTAGVSEVDFSGGLSSQGSYSSKVSCSNLYCHGDGQGHNGEMDLTGSAASCDDCHPGPSSGPSGWADMSGRHAVHMEEGLSCGDCHSATTTDGQSISGPTVHVDGEPTVEWDQDMKYDGKSCTGSCHNEEHNARTWQYP
jgi:predicted CxxxxCH...CXXCH cytochrome family protein